MNLDDLLRAGGEDLRSRARRASRPRVPGRVSAPMLAWRALATTVGVALLAGVIWLAGSLPGPGQPIAPVETRTQLSGFEGLWVFAEGSYLGSPIPQTVGVPVTLGIASGPFVGEGPCGSYSADVVIEGVSLSVGEPQRATEGCSINAQRAQRQYLAGLRSATTIRSIEGERLVISGPDVILHFVRDEWPSELASGWFPIWPYTSRAEILFALSGSDPVDSEPAVAARFVTEVLGWEGAEISKDPVDGFGSTRWFAEANGLRAEILTSNVGVRSDGTPLFAVVSATTHTDAGAHDDFVLARDQDQWWLRGDIADLLPPLAGAGSARMVELRGGAAAQSIVADASTGSFGLPLDAPPTEPVVLIIHDITGFKTDDSATVGIHTIVLRGLSPSTPQDRNESPNPSGETGTSEGSSCTLQPTVPVAMPEEQVVTVLFQCGGWEGFYPDVSTPLARVMPADLHPVEATLRALLAGPTTEETAAGVGSFFTADTADALSSVTIDGTRVEVDFNDAIYINNASTSAGSMFFMAELRANVFQHDRIDTVVWSVDGDCQAFGNWLQVGECMTDTRDDWETQKLSWADGDWPDRPDCQAGGYTTEDRAVAEEVPGADTPTGAAQSAALYGLGAPAHEETDGGNVRFWWVDDDGRVVGVGTVMPVPAGGWALASVSYCG